MRRWHGRVDRTVAAESDQLSSRVSDPFGDPGSLYAVISDQRFLTVRTLRETFVSVACVRLVQDGAGDFLLVKTHPSAAQPGPPSDQSLLVHVDCGLPPKHLSPKPRSLFREFHRWCPIILGV